MERTSENLEHIEHTQHAAHAPFDRNVAMTMAMVAAVLACIAMLSHRTHNERLGLLTEADTLHTQANTFQTKAADEWAYYQAKNIRHQEYQAMLGLLGVLPKDGAGQERAKALERDWSDKVAKYKKELPEHQEKARSLEEEAKKRVEEAEHKHEASEHLHHRGTGLDGSQLAVELALVLCSLAVLTKKAAFWYAGIAAGAVGVLAAVVALILL